MLASQLPRLLFAVSASRHLAPRAAIAERTHQTVGLSHSEAGSRLQVEAPPIVVLHGLFGAGNNFGTFAGQLDQALRDAKDPRRILLADLRNHGDSPHAEEMAFDVSPNEGKPWGLYVITPEAVADTE